MKKNRLLSLLLVLVMVLGMLPGPALAVEAQEGYATVEQLEAAFEKVGETDDVDAALAALDAYLAVYDRLSEEDQAANAEALAMAQAYRENLAAAKEAGEDDEDYEDPEINPLYSWSSGNELNKQGTCEVKFRVGAYGDVTNKPNLGYWPATLHKDQVGSNNAILYGTLYFTGNNTSGWTAYVSWTCGGESGTVGPFGTVKGRDMSGVTASNTTGVSFSSSVASTSFYVGSFSPSDGKPVHTTHDYTVRVNSSQWVKAPTCTEDGTATFKCSGCDLTTTKTVEGSKLGHSFPTTWTDDCTSHTDEDCTGHSQVCTRCNGTLDGGKKEHQAHTYGGWVTVTEAQPGVAGEKKHTCTACGHVETEVISALPETTTASYTVEWQDTDGNTLKTSETRNGTVGTTVSATDDDKSVRGYIYLEDQSTSSAKLAASGTKLTLVFAKKITVTWLKEDGTQIKQIEIPYGDDSYEDEYPTDPSTTGKWGDPETDGDGNITIRWEEPTVEPKPVKKGDWQLDITKEISNAYNQSGTDVTFDSLPDNFAVTVTVSYHDGTERVTKTATLSIGDLTPFYWTEPWGQEGSLTWNKVFMLPDWQFDFAGTGKTAADFAEYSTVITITEANYNISNYTCTVDALAKTPSTAPNGTTHKMENGTYTVTCPVQQSGSNHTQSRFGIRNSYQAPPPVPNKPTTEDLNNLRLGVWILCDEQTNHHDWTAYTIGTGYTAGEVTANTGSNKAQYPYTCTVNVTVDMQDSFWMNTNSATAGVKWNAEHQLKPNARTLTATLYYNGTKWTIPQVQNLNPDVALGGESGWNYLKILTVHKPEYTVTVKYVDENGKTIKNDVAVQTTNGGQYDVTDKQATISGYTLQKTDKALTGTVAEDTTITLTYKKDETPKPSLPTYEEIDAGVKAEVRCGPQRHEWVQFGSEGHVNFSTIWQDGQGTYLCDVTFLKDSYAKAYNDHIEINHTLVQNEVDKTAQFKWSAENQKWVLVNPYITKDVICFWVECPNTPTEYTITVKYVDENGKTIEGMTDATVNTTEGGKYDVNDKKVAIDGYTYQSADKDLNGKVTGNITITLTYKKDAVTPDPEPDPEPEDPTPTYYTVIYTDGVAGEEIFPDQVNRWLSWNEATPAFNGTPEREGWTFLGWSPAVADRVRGSVTYVAQWQENEPIVTPGPVETDEPTETPVETDEGEDLEENDTPLTEMPELPGETEGDPEPEEPNTPLPEAPEEGEESEELEEDDVPLADVPQTGDGLWFWVLMTLCSAAGLIVLVNGKKRRETK